jgi:hypothetical protein
MNQARTHRDDLVTAARELLDANATVDETPLAYRRMRDGWKRLERATLQAEKRHNEITSSASAIETIERIARDELHLETLDERKMDSLDFKEQAVWSIRKALLDAYAAGHEVGKKSSPRNRKL